MTLEGTTVFVGRRRKHRCPGRLTDPTPTPSTPSHKNKKECNLHLRLQVCTGPTKCPVGAEVRTRTREEIRRRKGLLYCLGPLDLHR